MKRHILVFLLTAAALFGAGLLVFHFALEENAPSGSVRPADRRPAPAGPADHTPPDGGVSAQPGTPAAAAGNVTVLTTRGRVERRQPGQTLWQPLVPGDKLAQQESIKTGSSATARLQVDQKSQMDLANRSELTVREISDAVHRFRLVRGRIRVDYDAAGGRVLKVEGARGDAVAESTAGTFVVQNASGIVSVATTCGQVELTAGERTVVVGSGKISRAAPGGQPEPATDIPLSVMLRVARPTTLRQRLRYTYVRGRTSPGARVTVNGTDARIGPGGTFRVRVQLQEGSNRIVAVAEDAAGNRVTRKLPEIIVDPNAPVDRMDIRWGPSKRGD